MIVNRLEKLCRICVESLVQRIDTGIRLKGWLKQKEKGKKGGEKGRDKEENGREKGQIPWLSCLFGLDAGAICKINETRRNINAPRMLLRSRSKSR